MLASLCLTICGSFSANAASPDMYLAEGQGELIATNCQAKCAEISNFMNEFSESEKQYITDGINRINQVCTMLEERNTKYHCEMLKSVIFMLKTNIKKLKDTMNPEDYEKLNKMVEDMDNIVPGSLEEE